MKDVFLKFCQDKAWRKQFIRYWLLDPFWGGLDLMCHYSFRLMPLSVPQKIGAFLGELAGKYRFQKANQRAEHCLKLLKPDLSDADRAQLLLAMWRNIGRTMSEYSIADLLWKDGRVTTENADVIKRCREQKRPIIFVTAHLGNWEVISGYCIDNNLDSLSLYQPERNRFVTQLAEKSRKKLGTRTVAAGRQALRRMSQHLTQGHVVWLAIDEYKKGRVWGPLLGRDLDTRSSNAAYAVRLAQRHHAAIIPYRTERKPLSHFVVTFYEPLFVNNNADEIRSALDKQVESWVREHPEQWYMLHEFRS